MKPEHCCLQQEHLSSSGRRTCLFPKLRTKNITMFDFILLWCMFLQLDAAHRPEQAQAQAHRQHVHVCCRSRRC